MDLKRTFGLYFKTMKTSFVMGLNQNRSKPKIDWKVLDQTYTTSSKLNSPISVDQKLVWATLIL